jgi:serine/threonine protein kinase
VALKTVQKKNLRPVEILQTLREIEVLKVCSHPHVVKMEEHFDEHDQYIMVLELLDQDLFDYL